MDWATSSLGISIGAGAGAGSGGAEGFVSFLEGFFSTMNEIRTHHNHNEINMTSGQ